MSGKEKIKKSKKRVEKLLVQTDLSKTCMTFLEWQRFMKTVPLFSQAEVISEFLKLIDNPIRLKIILILLERDWACNCEFEYAFNAHQTLISHNLKLLREKGVIQFTKSGQWNFYKLTNQAKEFFLAFRSLFLQTTFLHTSKK
ncbi:MAG: ArsR/SmtB family transcription factor [Candidatus Heimdallarchaeota archaeon]